jgi:hypothetical protein
MFGDLDLNRAADQLGLRLGRDRLDGSVDGSPVHVSCWSDYMHGVQGGLHIGFAVGLNPPLDMRLSVARASLADKIGDLVGKHDIRVGDAPFDDAFTIRADEPARASALLTPWLRQRLAPWRNIGGFCLNDNGVHAHIVSNVGARVTAEDVVRDVRALVALAKAVDEAARAVPPSARLVEHVNAWRAYAAANSFAFAPSPLRIGGEIGASEFVARAAPVPDESTYGVDLRLRFQERLPFALHVRPAQFLEVFDRVTGESFVKTGHAYFDDALRVSSNDAAAATAFLNEHVRTALLDLHRAEGHVTLDSEGLAVRTRRMIPPDEFARMIERIDAIVCGEIAAARPRAATHAYR